MTKLEIQIPDDLEFDKMDGNTIKLKKKNRPVIERIKTIQDVLTELGEDDDDVAAYLISKRFGLSEHLVNYQLAILITKAFNEGWKPNWDNSNEYKYYAWFEMGGSSGFRFRAFDVWGSHSSVGSRLCFKTHELAEYAGKTFTNVYKQFMTLDEA